MANILTQEEATAVLRLSLAEWETDPLLDLILPAVDDYLKNATGYDWASDAVIDPLAKQVAMMLLVQWYENPAQVGSIITESPLAFGVNNLIGQLTVKKLPAA